MEDVSSGDRETFERRKPVSRSPDSQLTITVKLDIQPTHVLISTRADAKLELSNSMAGEGMTSPVFKQLADLKQTKNTLSLQHSNASYDQIPSSATKMHRTS